MEKGRKGSTYVKAFILNILSPPNIMGTEDG